MRRRLTTTILATILAALAFTAAGGNWHWLASAAGDTSVWLLAAVHAVGTSHRAQAAATWTMAHPRVAAGGLAGLMLAFILFRVVWRRQGDPVTTETDAGMRAIVLMEQKHRRTATGAISGLSVLVGEQAAALAELREQVEEDAEHRDWLQQADDEREVMRKDAAIMATEIRRLDDGRRHGLTELAKLQAVLAVLSDTQSVECNRLTDARGRLDALQQRSDTHAKLEDARQQGDGWLVPPSEAEVRRRLEALEEKVKQPLMQFDVVGDAAVILQRLDALEAKLAAQQQNALNLEDDDPPEWFSRIHERLDALDALEIEQQVTDQDVSGLKIRLNDAEAKADRALALSGVVEQSSPPGGETGQQIGKLRDQLDTLQFNHRELVRIVTPLAAGDRAASAGWNEEQLAKQQREATRGEGHIDQAAGLRKQDPPPVTVRQEPQPAAAPTTNAPVTEPESLPFQELPNWRKIVAERPAPEPAMEKDQPRYNCMDCGIKDKAYYHTGKDRRCADCFSRWCEADEQPEQPVAEQPPAGPSNAQDVEPDRLPPLTVLADCSCGEVGSWHSTDEVPTGWVECNECGRLAKLP